MTGDPAVFTAEELAAVDREALAHATLVRSCARAGQRLEKCGYPFTGVSTAGGAWGLCPHCWGRHGTATPPTPEPPK